MAPHPRKGFVVFTAASLCAAVAMTAWQQVAMKSALPSQTDDPIDFSIRSNAQDIEVYADQHLRVSGSGGLFLTGGTYTVAIEEMGWQQTLSAAQVLDGATLPIHLTSLGSFDVVVTGEYGEISRIPVNSIIGEELALGDNIVWTLSVGTPQPPDGERPAYRLPVQAIAKTRRGSPDAPLLPVRVLAHTQLTVIDEHGSSAAFDLVVEPGDSTSGIHELDLDFIRTYRLRIEGVTQEPQSIDVSWSTHGPPLTLAAEPPRQRQFATPITPAHVDTYFEWHGRLAPPPGGTTISPTASSPVSLEIESSVGNVRRFRAIATSAAANAKIAFKDLHSGLSATVVTDFVSPGGLLTSATLAGAIGLLVTGRFRTWLRSAWWVIPIEIVGAAAAGLLLYLAFILGWMPFSVNPSLVGFLPAIAIGLIGGFMGQGVFVLIRSIITATPGA